ncbi:MAG TPA: S8 family serine peptidase [Verrucomicrobiae bacterium]|nr:S8 family serine peptidase [Verrucomicrobiae bacterium]
MQRRRLLWGILAGMVVVIVAVLWHGNREGARTREPVQAATVGPRHEDVPELLQNQSARPVPRTQTKAGLETGATKTNVSHNIPLLAYRIKNTQRPLGELVYSDSAILLRNALFDAAEAAPLDIPAHLKAQGDPGSYVVQARGPIDQAFLARLKAVGAEIISYIPNNAYLVRAQGSVANQLAAAPETQSVLLWEPYFKLDLSLLARAVNNEPLADNERVSIVVFPGQREAGIKAIEDLGGTIVAEDGSPFGHQLITHPRSDTLVALAQLPIVQSIEPSRSRMLLNDLSRLRVSVSTNSLPAGTNWMGLYGSNIIVNVNDTGAEAAHPDLAGRVIGATAAARFDNQGHGTHVAGTIASSGANSPSNGPGSIPGATFRGIAPNAKIFSQRIDLLTGPNSDIALHETVARTNILISNNSWAYPIGEYNQSAAIYDAAVRDALPGVGGQTPMIFVFAAGNSGAGDTEGDVDTGDTVESPATGKNVISVGAFENLRNLTNSFQMNGDTNTYFLPETDSEDQVAFYSSRGNVGVGLEGDFGRFKPDVVAPGSWIISCRASQWRDPDSLLRFNPFRLVDQYIDRKGTNFYFRTIPDNATALIIYLLRNPQSPATLPRLEVHTRVGSPPVVNAADLAGVIPPPLQITPVTPGQIHFALVNTNSIAFHYDLLTLVVTTNDLGEYYSELKKLNDQLAPYYRFESGTSMSAGVVSGTLALMQEFFATKMGRTNVSPALYKAMLINGARSLSSCVGCDYDLQVRKQVNHQGWGSIRLTNSLPKAMAFGSGSEPSWPTILVDQDPDNTLATGESHTYNIQMSTRARSDPLMVTLVWTDPPGNPVASVKLVNDLDLIVTNTATGDYYVGNNIPASFDFTEPIFAGDSNAAPFDVVNNVENVYIQPRLSTNYTVTVRARRVNVNAITSNTNGTRQDYALVISSGNSTLTNTFLNFTPPIVKSLGTNTNPYLQNLSNKVALLNQRVGANSPQLPVVNGNLPSPSDGSTNQWNFYVFNNTNALFTNVAFFTFMAPDLSLPRVREADIDLYVSRDGNLTNLALINGSTILANTLKSTTRGGTELVVIPNAGVGEYFIGVKSEDQQAAQFGIMGIAQQKPFGEQDANGNYLLDFDVSDGCIPDGTPANPSGRQFFAIIYDMGGGVGPGNRTMRRVVLTNDVDHQLGGDLLGTVTSFPFGNGGGNPVSAVLNNHRAFQNFNRFIYDDSGENDIPLSQQSDGPGTLRDFEGKSLTALWQFTMVDNTPHHTGCVLGAIGMIEPQQDTNNFGNNGIRLRIGAQQWRYTAIDVPLGVTNLQVFVRHEPGFQLPVDVYIRRGARPTLTVYDKYGRVDYPGGVVEHGRYDFPSLQSGRYHIGIYNPNNADVELRLFIAFQYSLSPIETTTYESGASTTIPDDLTTSFTMAVTNARTVAAVKVGVRIDHPRLSDLALHLVSPEGTRILLTENRGLSLGTNYGEGIPQSFVIPFTSNGDANEFRTNINTTVRQGVVRLNVSPHTLKDTFRVYYDGKRIFDSGYISGDNIIFNIPYGPGLSTFVEVVVNEGGNPDGLTAWDMEIAVTGPWNYAYFTDQQFLGGPIKFAFPPYSRIPTNVTVFSNSFENAIPGIYATNPSPPAITTVDDWTVTSNYVAVLTDSTNVAHTGTNFLALSHGAISRGITNLLPGHEYVLNFGERKISSSPTQNIHVVVPTDDTPFEAVFPVPPPGADDPVEVPKLRVCPGQDVVVISTNEVDFGGLKYTAQGDTNIMVNGFPKYGLIGCWSSHPTVLDTNTMASVPFYIGGGPSNNVVIAAPTQAGDYYLFLGVNDDDYAGNTGSYEVDLRWAQCQLANANYVLGTTPVAFDGKWRTNWAGESLFFVGNPTTTNIGFSAGHNSTILLDTVIIEELIPSAHYQSEEPLAPLQGQTAMGDWKLEITDNRVGPPVVGTNYPTLLSWALKFIFDDGPAPIPLTNGVPFNLSVRGAEMHYFVVNVPFEVNTNQIHFSSSGNNGGIELLYSTTGLPEGTQPPDPILPTPEIRSPLGVASNAPAAAPITPGRPYFLAIRNADTSGASSNAYTITVNFTNVPVRQLVDNVPIFTTAMVPTLPPLPATFLQTRADSSLAVANMHYYYFDVGATDPLATNVFVYVGSPTPADVHLVASRALPVTDLFPRPTSYEYHSTETRQDDVIIITSNSIPVKLAPGRWYFGVYNVGTAPADYVIQAHESRAPLFNLTRLEIGTNSHVLTNFTAGGRLESFYHFVTHDTNAAVLFEIFNLTNMVSPPVAQVKDVDLIVRRSDLPSLDLYDFSFLVDAPSLPPPMNQLYEPIPLRTNIFIPTLGVNTNWYITIANRGPYNVSGQLCITVFPNINPIVGCQFNAYFNQIGTNVNICWTDVGGSPPTKYDVEMSTNLINWIKVWTNVPPPCAAVYPDPALGAQFFRVRGY